MLKINMKVSPDKRKGLLMVTQSDDQLMHLQWKVSCDWSAGHNTHL